MIVVSLGCPASVGPEVAVAAVRKARGVPRVLVGSWLATCQAAEMLGIPRRAFARLDSCPPGSRAIRVLDPGPELTSIDLEPEKATRAAGRSQLAAVEAAFELVRGNRGAALVTGPVSKTRVAASGARGAKRFTGHTEWLQRLDGATSSTMCFYSPRLTTSLVTTHLPLSRVARSVTPERVSESTVQLARFLSRLDRTPPVPPRIAVCSLNPHAGESELLGSEESRAIVPGIALARRRLRGSALISGPMGAESAYRLAHEGHYEGVVAMYHDQATVPMKLVAFGSAVNVTLGLSRVRTSVDHGTAYDIAWTGKADARGMHSALALARRLVA